MNPALTPLSQIREMTNAELVAFAKEHSTLTILEREFLRRMEHMGKVLSSGKDLVASDEYQSFIRNKVGILNGAIVRSKIMKHYGWGIVGKEERQFATGRDKAAAEELVERWNKVDPSNSYRLVELFYKEVAK